MTDFKKLLVVSSTYPANDSDKVPRFVYDQIKSFSILEPELKIDVLSPHNQASNSLLSKSGELPNVTEHRFHYFIPRYERLTDRGIMPALSVNKLNYLLLPFFMFAEFISLLILTIRIKPDIIYAHWFTPQAISAGIVSFITRTPYGYTTHASDVDVWRRFGPLGTLIVRVCSRNAKAITAVSTQTKRRLEHFFTKPLEIFVIPMGIYLPEKPPITQNLTEALFIGRLTEKKGLHYLFPAIRQIVRDYPEFTLTVAGDGEERNKLETQVNELGLEKNVSFVGFVTGAQKTNLLKSRGLMLVPSIITKSGDAEGLPVSLMEGLSYGMVVVATAASGAEDIIRHEKNGFIVTSQGSEALYEQIRNVLSLAPKQVSSVSQKAFESAQNISWPVIGERHLHVFSDVISRE